MFLATSLGFFDWLIGILLFILGLSFLIALHELGHLLTAKIFGVYCHEYSIGFGPKLFSIKPKNKETTFSLRAIPLGGYVSMFGEESKDEEEFKDIPHERSLEGVAKWKRAIIFVAGVTVNFILGVLLILTSNLAFPKFYNAGYVSQEVSNAEYYSIVFSDDSPYKEDGNIYLKLPTEESTQIGTYNYIDNNVTIPNEEGRFLLFTNPLYRTTSAPILSDSIAVFKYDDEGNIDFTSEYKFKQELTLNINLTYVKDNDVAHEIIKPATLKVVENLNKYVIDDIGIRYVIKSRYLGFGEAFTRSFKQFGNLFTQIIKAIGGLFTGESFKNVGGIVAIAAQVTEYNANHGFSMFLFYMGFLSINLGIFNLIPFPGLDGWSLLVLIVEAISRKKIPQKVKGIISIIGLVLLFTLMVFIIVKDVIGLVV